MPPDRVRLVDHAKRDRSPQTCFNLTAPLSVVTGLVTVRLVTVDTVETLMETSVLETLDSVAT
jgi:hypothetical protein